MCCCCTDDHKCDNAGISDIKTQHACTSCTMNVRLTVALIVVMIYVFLFVPLHNYYISKSFVSTYLLSGESLDIGSLSFAENSLKL